MKALMQENGNSLVEFALSSSVLFMLMFGIIQFSMGLYTYNFLTYAAKDAARFAMVRGSNCTNLTGCNQYAASFSAIQTFVASEGYPGVNPASIAVTPSWTCEAVGPNNPNAGLQNANCNAPGDMVTVTLKYPYTLNIPFWKPTLMTFSATSSMVISN